jgi:hypothetical protein
MHLWYRSQTAKQAFPVVLTIDVDNGVVYRSDIADSLARAQKPK